MIPNFFEDGSLSPHTVGIGNNKIMKSDTMLNNPVARNPLLLSKQNPSVISGFHILSRGMQPMPLKMVLVM